MVKGRKTFDRGEIVRVTLNPTKGRELQGDFRPALVLTKREFNVLGLALIAPITSGGDFSRFAGFTVSLSGTGLKTSGVVLVNGVRMLDLSARAAEKVEDAPEYIVDDVLARLNALIE
jgi:mRNA interferase ChpB